MKRVILIFMLLGCLMGTGWAQIYVSSAMGDDSSPGTSWTTAKKTIAAGIAAAGANGTVFVKAGQYAITEELVVPAGKIVLGGYDPSSTGTDTSRRHLPGANMHWTDTSWCSVVAGSGNHRIATVHGLLDGFVIRLGFSNTKGGGVLIDGSNAVVRYCVIKECDALSENEIPSQGGGAYVQNNGTLLNCVVTECRASKGAGVAGGNGSLISNTITRNTPIDCGVVTDIDGNRYNTVVLGEQCWMRENLRTTRFPDGTEIPVGTTSSANQPYRYDGYASPLTPELFVRHGYMYNWTAVMHGSPGSSTNPSGVQGICPTGWHVPSKSEWEQLCNYVRSVSRFWCNNNSNYIVKALSSNVGWSGTSYNCRPGNNPSTNNATRFSAIPTGYYNSNNNFYDFGSRSEYWTTTVYNSSNAYRQTFNSESDCGTASAAYSYGYTVRCVKDE